MPAILDTTTSLSYNTTMRNKIYKADDTILLDEDTGLYVSSRRRGMISYSNKINANTIFCYHPDNKFFELLKDRFYGHCNNEGITELVYNVFGFRIVGGGEIWKFESPEDELIFNMIKG